MVMHAFSAGFYRDTAVKYSMLVLHIDHSVLVPHNAVPHVSTKSDMRLFIHHAVH
jgi:hypothetical protein